MCRLKRHLKWFYLLLLVGVCGCAPPAEPKANDDEGQRVRSRFEAFRKALSETDVETLWAMLSKQSQGDADRAARTLRAEYEKADAKTRADREKELGLSAAELAALTGRGFLKTRPFLAKYEEARQGKFDHVSAQGDTATVYYFDDEGDREKLLLVREDGQWLFWLKMPAVRHQAEEAKDEKRR